jgi:multiple sugar transport system substrate-binding protein
MERKMKTMIRLLLAVMVLGMLVTACGTPAEPTKAPTSAPSQAQATKAPEPTKAPAPTQGIVVPPGQMTQPTKAPEPTKAAAPAQPGDSPYKKYAGTKLVASWPSLGPYQTAAKLLPEFTKETGIQVEVDFTDYTKIKDKQILELAKPTGDYDVLAWTVYDKNELISKGLLTPLSQFFANPALVDPNYDAEDIIAAYRNTGGVGGGTKGYLAGPTQGLFGLPYGAETSILIYRKDIFEQYKLKVPETYEEMLTTAEWISKNVPNMKGMTTRGQSGHQITAAWLLHLSPYGGTIFDTKWNPVFNDAAGIKAAETLKKIMDNSPAGVNNYDFGAATSAFLQGQSAMYVDSHKLAAMTRNPDTSKVDGKVAYALHPKDKTGLSETGGQAMGIASNSKKKEAAFLLIQWLTSKAQDKKAVLMGGDPIRMSTLKDPELVAKFPEYPIVAKQLENANPDWRPLVYEWQTTCVPIIGTSLSEYVTGQKTAKQALDEATTKVKDVMNRAGYYSWSSK